MYHNVYMRLNMNKVIIDPKYKAGLRTWIGRLLVTYFGIGLGYEAIFNWDKHLMNMVSYFRSFSKWVLSDPAIMIPAALFFLWFMSLNFEGDRETTEVSLEEYK